MKRNFENYYKKYELCPCGFNDATGNLHFSQSQLDYFLDKYFEPLKQENADLKANANKIAIEKLEEAKCQIGEIDIRDDYTEEYWWQLERVIDKLIAELKGGSNE